MVSVRKMSLCTCSIPTLHCCTFTTIYYISNILCISCEVKYWGSLYHLWYTPDRQLKPQDLFDLGLRFYFPLNTKWQFWRRSSQSISWPVGLLQKLSITQQKQTLIIWAFVTRAVSANILNLEHKNTKTQNKHKKSKARFGRLVQPPAWKWSRPYSTACGPSDFYSTDQS